MPTKNDIENLTSEELFHNLQSSVNGLSDHEAASRLETYGPNILKNEAKITVLKLIGGQFKNALIYMLVLASILAFLLRDLSDGFIILTILIINTGLGFYQEYRSQNAVTKLQKLVSKEALVKRDGKETLTVEHLIVPGDVVILKEGDVVPADIKLTHVNDLSVNESQLTGESAPVIKSNRGVSS